MRRDGLAENLAKQRLYVFLEASVISHDFACGRLPSTRDDRLGRP